jgi:ABC-type uncharacterized transport system auxiliary subunit
MNRRQGIAGFFILTAILLQTGCASTGPAPQDHYYRLTAPDTAQPLEAPLIQGVLTVDRIKAPGILRERALLYSLESSPEEVKQYRYHHWIGTLPNMIREQLVVYLRQSNIAAYVEGEQTTAEADVRLKIKLKKFERVLSNKGDGAMVSLKLEVVVTSDRRPEWVMMQGYSVVEPASDKTMLASVRAMNEGLGEIYLQLLTDLRRFMRST